MGGSYSGLFADIYWRYNETGTQIRIHVFWNDTAWSATGTRALWRSGDYAHGASGGLLAFGIDILLTAMGRLTDLWHDAAHSSTGTCVMGRGGDYRYTPQAGLFSVAPSAIITTTYLFYGFNDTSWSYSGTRYCNRGGSFSIGASDGLFSFDIANRNITNIGHGFSCSNDTSWSSTASRAMLDRGGRMDIGTSSGFFSFTSSTASSVSQRINLHISFLRYHNPKSSYIHVLS